MTETIAYSKTFPVLWSDLDPNGHMRGPRYLEYAAEMPFHFLADNGFDFALFAKEKIGPVTFSQSIKHLKEVNFGDSITVDYLLKGASDDNSRWAFRHSLSRRDGTKAAIVEAEGAFFNLVSRKICPPPAGLAGALNRLPRPEDFVRF
jgi:acyl-CoA thioester hydrolase